MHEIEILKLTKIPCPCAEKKEKKIKKKETKIPQLGNFKYVIKYNKKIE
jgi:hypothetical protein